MQPHRPPLQPTGRFGRRKISASSRTDRRKALYLTPEARLRAVPTNFKEAAAHDLNVNEIADLFHVSYAHLTRLLKSVGLPPPMRQIRIIRLKEAAQRLEQGAFSLEELANDFGYSNAASLRRAFRRILGKTVTDLRSGHTTKGK